MTKEKEKRIRKRVAYIIDSIFYPTDGEKISGTIQDLSMNGFYLKTARPRLKNTIGELKILLKLGDKVKTVQATCRVTRTDTDGMALTITQINEESSITLFNMIKFYL